MTSQIQCQCGKAGPIYVTNLSPPTSKEDLKSPPISITTQPSNEDITIPRPGMNIQKISKAVLAYFIDQWFLVGLGVVIAIASQRQVSEENQDLKETVVTYLCVSVIFLITGCTLPTKVLLANYARWKLHIFVQVSCFLVTSATTFGVVSAAATNQSFMDPGLLVGMIMAGCVPTTISSNVVLTRQAHGNTALTVVQSTLGNLLGPFIVPVLLRMYTGTGAWYDEFLPNHGADTSAVYKRVFKQLGLSLFIPLVAGQIIQNVFPKATDTVMKKWKISKVASFALLTIIWSTYDQAFQSGAFSALPASNMVFIVFISVALFSVWLIIAFVTARMWLPREDTVAICYCVPAKTPAMGVPLIQTIFFGLSRLDQSKIQIPIVIFQGLQIAGGSLLVPAFRWWVAQGKAQEKPRIDEETASQEHIEGIQASK